MELRKYQRLSFDVYFSPDVPTALVLDLQGHVQAVRVQLTQRLGVEDRTIPDLYVMGSLKAFGAAGATSGLRVTIESGFFAPGGNAPGIYLLANKPIPELKKTLTHEYTHLLVEEGAGTSLLPAWFNEGTATYYENVIGLTSSNPDVARNLDLLPL
ncbi:MAG: hypothetical protein EXR67_03580 [Dehalococcoidia bacterium]|nr:hypothetical protein [Dehalococcoidia bacterium]